MLFRENQLKALVADRSVLIAGFGREGQSTLRLLSALFPGRQFDVAHNNEEIARCLAVRAYDLVVKSPGIPVSVFDNRCPSDVLTSQTDLFLQVFSDITLGVTGTKGKSTTATLLHHVLSHTVAPGAILAGNIGVPLFDIVPQLAADSLVVAELSCHQLEVLHRAPHNALLLNLHPEHLDHYRDYAAYQMAKLNIALCQRPGDAFFYCDDDPDTHTLVARLRTAMQGDEVPYRLETFRPMARHLRTALQGDHNVSNIAAVYHICHRLGVADEPFASALETFQPLEHRLEYVCSRHGITFYNDSISTIPAACEAAVNALHNVDTLILGGFDRSIDYTPLAIFLAASQVRHFVFVGAAGRRIFEAVENIRPIEPERRLFSDDYPTIVAWCYTHTTPGCVCLLSPAAASYDAFKNFEERGRVFKSLVTEYQP